MSLFGTGRLGLSAGCRRRSMVLLHIPDTLVGRLVLPRGRGALGRGGRDGGLADQGKSHRKNDGKNRGKDFLHFCLLRIRFPGGVRITKWMPSALSQKSGFVNGIFSVLRLFFRHGRTPNNILNIHIFLIPPHSLKKRKGGTFSAPPWIPRGGPAPRKIFLFLSRCGAEEPPQACRETVRRRCGFSGQHGLPCRP